MVYRANAIWELYRKYGLLFVEFPDRCFLVCKGKWNDSSLSVVGRVMKQDDLWVFSSLAHPGKWFYGATKVNAVRSFLRSEEA